MDYTTVVDHRHSIVTHVQIDLCSECQTFDIHPWSESSELDTNGLVEIGSQTAAQSIRSVLLLNTACLASLAGAKPSLICYRPFGGEPQTGGSPAELQTTEGS